jgi:hypothetical protein
MASDESVLHRQRLSSHQTPLPRDHTICQPARHFLGDKSTMNPKSNLKKTILTLLLAAMSAGAMAEWVQYAETEQIVYYIDAATIRRDGNFRKVWLVQDLKQRQKYGAMSRRFLQEFDCKKERFRFLSISVHSGPMASGETLGPT